MTWTLSHPVVELRHVDIVRESMVVYLLLCMYHMVSIWSQDL